MPKGNPNPSPATRFKPGVANGGRNPGSRDRLTSAFLYELAEDFDAEGKAAIVKLRENDVGRYIGAIVALVPKEVNLVAQPLDGIEDSKLTEAIETLTEAIRSQMPMPPPPKDEERVVQ